MPPGLTPGDRKLFLVAGGVFCALVAVSALLSGGMSNTAERTTTYSAGSSGAKAAYLFLEATGYRVERWEQEVRDLPSGAGATLILAEPENAPTVEERAGVSRFIEEGGRVIATGLSGSLFLPERRVTADAVNGITWKRIPSVSPSSITRAAAEITLAPQSFWDAQSFALPLYADENPRVVEYRFGAGDVIWWAAATPLTNAGVGEPGNLEFFLACLRGAGSRAPQGGQTSERILWDEFFHGHRQVTAASVIQSPLMGLGLQLALFAAAVLVTYSRRSGPIVPSRVERRLSPLEFVRTLGSLYQRAGAASVAVDIAYQRFRFALTQRLGLAGNASADDLERASRERWRLDAEFGNVLRASESAGSDVGLSATAALKLNRSLSDYAATLELYRVAGKESA